MGIIVRESGTGKVINVSKDLPQSLKGKTLTTEQSKAISAGKYTTSRSGVKVTSSSGGTTIIQDQPLQEAKTTISPATIKRQEDARIAQVRKQEDKPISPNYAYDTISKQTRPLTSYEQIGARSSIAQQRTSVDPRSQPIDNRTYTQVRDDLIRDPEVSKVYVQADKSGTKIVGVEQKPSVDYTSFAPEQKTSKSQSNFENYPYPIVKREEKPLTFREKVRDQAKGYLEGFSFEGKGNPAKQPFLYLFKGDKYSYTPPRNVGQAIGGYVGIASFGVGGGIGTGLANLAYKYPKIYKGLQVASKFSKTKTGTSLLRAGAFSYGFGSVVKGVQAYRQEGVSGPIGVGLNVVRTITLIKTGSSSFKSQTASNFEKNIYLVKGSSKGTTYTNKNLFSSNIKTSGKVYTFTQQGKLLDVKRVKDFSTFTGTSRSVKTEFGKKTGSDIVRGNIKSSTQFYTPKKVVRKDATLYNFRTTTTYPKSGMSQLSSNTNIDAVIGTKNTFQVRTGGLTIGRGSSKFNFKAETYKPFSNTYSRTAGGGSAKFDYTTAGDITKIKGVTGSSTPKVSSKIKFDESIFNIGKRSPISSATGSLKTKYASESISNSIAGSLKTQQISSVKVPTAVVGSVKAKTSQKVSPILEQPKPISIPTKSSGTSKIVQVQATRERVKAKLQPMVATPKQELFLEGKPRTTGRSKGKARSTLGNVQVNNLGLSQGQTPIISIGLTQSFKQGQRQTQDQRSTIKPVSIMETPQVPSPRSIVGGGFITPPSKVPPPTFLFIPSYNQKKKKKSKKTLQSVSRKTDYSPSVEASMFGITASKKPSKELIESGLFTRPILRRRR